MKFRFVNTDLDTDEQTVLKVLEQFVHPVKVIDISVEVDRKFGRSINDTKLYRILEKFSDKGIVHKEPIMLTVQNRQLRQIVWHLTLTSRNALVGNPVP